MNVNSSLFKELSQDEILSVVNKDFQHDELITYDLMKGGAFNTTYLLTLRSGKYVLRAGPVNRHLILPFEYCLMPAENYVYGLLAEHGIPTSAVRVCDTSKALADRDYIIVEYIDAVPMCDKAVEKEQKPYLFEMVGCYTAKMHEIKGEYFGFVSNSFRNIKFGTWYDFLLSNVADIAKCCLDYEIFDKTFLETFENIYKSSPQLYSKVDCPRLVHYDLWEGNVLVAQTSGKYDIAAIIDADRAVFGDIDFELATPWITNEHFFKGYGVISDDSKVRELKILSYRLMLRVMEAYIHKIEYNNLPECEACQKTAFDMAAEFLAAKTALGI